MRFKLEFRQSVREYLRNLPLTRNGRVRVNAALIQMAAEVPDSFRSDPANRLGPFHYYFNHIFMDGGRVWLLRVVVDDSTAAYGVLRIVYADCQ